MQLIYSDAGNEGEGSNLVVVTHVEWRALQQWLQTANGGFFGEWYSEYAGKLADLGLDRDILTVLERAIQSPGTAFRNRDGQLLDYAAWTAELRSDAAHTGASQDSAPDAIDRVPGCWIRGLEREQRRQLLAAVLAQN